MLTTVSNLSTLNHINRLDCSEQEHLKNILLDPRLHESINPEQLLIAPRQIGAQACPHCRNTHVIRNGHKADGTQRYLCRNCGKSFIVRSQSVTAGTRKDLSVWETYIDCMLKGMSIRKTAAVCGIHRNTAFNWKHKILEALQNNSGSLH